ncbi:SGNH/GDSL hydrolase family protein [Rapidithrix thailandica]|uniref:SGNH/GDSL hydrolase family protein n=1 Tax=Rapidithrix thailandica TaxID=413964 RepID=A0AAW9SD41_9BACT
MGQQTSQASGIKEEYPVFQMQEFHLRNGLPNIFHKIEHQRQVRIGYIGGSITAAENGWRALTFHWFQLTFPHTAFYQVDATVGGTGSGLGVFRMERDVLSQKPDLLFVEFAVNDASETRESILRSMEGLIRKTRIALPHTDICLVYTTATPFCEDLAKGKPHLASEAMEELARHYGIPSIHMGMEIARLYAQGKLTLTAPAEENARTIVFTDDNYHPLTESGHPLYASVVVKYLNEMRKDSRKKKYFLPSPYVKDHWQQARMLEVSQTELQGDWTSLSEEQDLNREFEAFVGGYPPLVYKGQPGAVMTFSFKGHILGFYDCVGPKTGLIELSIDGEKQEISRFDRWCKDFRKHNFFVKELHEGVHKVEIKVLDKTIDKAAELRKKGVKMQNPEKFAETNWYPVSLLIVGKLLKQ